jgi:hypothetical protein
VQQQIITVSDGTQNQKLVLAVGREEARLGVGA